MQSQEVLSPRQKPGQPVVRTMNLDDTQRKRVAEWIWQGLKISDIQNRLATDLGLSLTYMDVRLLVDDLKLTPKDVERPKPAGSALQAPAPAASACVGAPRSAAQPPAGPPKP